ncbi:MAG: hypothetical protein CBC02_009175 [Flavobacteriaceae bacterium TMED42]|nr:MAG: hypothetical protein CBC02_009175 [Flavobacteriaceae bacterium TMED42]
MGLDQYAYARDPRIERDEEDEDDWGGDVHIMDWRKHNRLQGYMEQIWLEQGGEYGESWGDGFNGKEVKLGNDEINALEEVINNRDLPETSGFFFGNDSYEDYENEDWGYLKSDLEFISEARRLISEGFEVYYNSSW